jgi:hypothetical protein
VNAARRGHYLWLRPNRSVNLNNQENGGTTSTTAWVAAAASITTA